MPTPGRSDRLRCVAVVACTQQKGKLTGAVWNSEYSCAESWAEGGGDGIDARDNQSYRLLLQDLILPIEGVLFVKVDSVFIEQWDVVL